MKERKHRERHGFSWNHEGDQWNRCGCRKGYGMGSIPSTHRLWYPLDLCTTFKSIE